ncbi:hypothetical protein FHS42_007485 [Streptomyces zagrosensis]|uniref:Uncharacterized protein n=1 Tax=Streptomyces zagrosensis TaxID=1042984 RepID=A0A7W9QJY4_9ACTN|nr:hypothetical protein [Streptomyces zagrosensis]
MSYLDSAPFAAQNVAVIPFRPLVTSIWSSGRQLSDVWALVSLGRRPSSDPVARRRADAADTDQRAT